MPKYQELPSTIFTLTERNHKSTTLHDDCGRVVYWIETSTKKVIKLFKPSADEEKECIAELDFHVFGTSTVTFAGTKQTLKEMFPARKLKTGRKAKTPMGECVWNPGKKAPFLRIEKRLLARYASNKRVFHQSSPATLAVANEALEFLDLIIVGWIVTMRDMELGEKGESISTGVDMGNLAMDLVGALT